MIILIRYGILYLMKIERNVIFSFGLNAWIYYVIRERF